MKTLIIPCAGRSSRFPNMKPKYILTHPDGRLMVEKAIEGLDLAQFDRIIITILKEHSDKYESELILQQIFSEQSKVEILVLEKETSCQAETVYETVRRKDVSGAFVVKDVDNRICLAQDDIEANCVAGVNLETFEKEITRLRQKSFLIVNDQSIIVDIIEKSVRSKYVCVGLYSFASTEQFCEAFLTLKQNAFSDGEIYLSHVISYLIGTGKCLFRLKEVRSYDDWGTSEEWLREQARYRTYFVDLDGVLCRNRGKYGSKNWENDFELIKENVDALRTIAAEGGQIVITTCRDKKYSAAIRARLEEQGLPVFAMITNCNHARRVLINDFAPTNAYPSCEAINIPRNGKLKDYLT